MTGTLTEEDVIEQLDFEPTVACEIELDGCTKVATVLVICRKCRFGTPSCGECIATVKAGFAAAQSRFGTELIAICVHCNAPTMVFDELWLVVPLKGGA